ncbi:GspH/FimT family protein [Natronobiforma cellulositropha]|uniref:GspH/FimT family protein n=1 Tax=Natronobiforma cellulositropha TaxID=1679076 RepID=UPI0021D5C00D|nr:GspH/FimT family protein [Natronobiforma cellulositropha]
MGLRDRFGGAVADWLEWARAEAVRRNRPFEVDPFDSKATFRVGEAVAGVVRESVESERAHDVLWHEYRDEPFVERAYPDARVCTVVLDLREAGSFDPAADHFAVVDAAFRPSLPGTEAKRYVYIEEAGRYYYNDGGRVYLPADAWETVGRSASE